MFEVENSFFNDVISDDERKLQRVKSSCRTYVGDDVCVYTIGRRQSNMRRQTQEKHLYLVE